MSIVDDIKARIDIVDYIGQYVPLKKSGAHFKAPCPFHSEKTASFFVSADRQSYRCFGACEDGGDLFTFAMKKHGWTFREALRELGASVGIEVEPSPPSQIAREQQADKLRGIVEQAVAIYVKLLHHPKAAYALAYTRERGLTDEAIERWQIGYAFDEWDIVTKRLRTIGYSDDDLIAAGISKRGEKGGVYDTLRARLVLPICDERGRAIALAGRTMAGADPKWLNTPATAIFEKSKTLFALDRAKESIREEGAVIVEGYLDAITAHEAGFTNVVAQMGTALTGAQVEALGRYLYVDGNKRNPVILALDGDKAGLRAAFNSIANHIGKEDFRVLRLESGDPDDVIRANPETWRELRQNAQALDDFLIEYECAALPESATFHQKQAVALKLLPLFAQSEHQLLVRYAAQKLAVRLGLDENTLVSMALKQKPAAAPPKPAPATATKPAPVQPTVTVRPVEFDIVACLFAEPRVLYQITKAFREANAAVPLEPDDFADTTNRALVRLLIDSQKQFDLDEVEYVRQQGGAWVDEALAALPKHNDPSACIQWAKKLRIWRLEAELEHLRQIEDGEPESAQRLRRDRRQLRANLTKTWQV